MKNEIEVIDGVKGEWRTVTKASEVTVGQRVRYGIDSIDWGHEKGELGHGHRFAKVCKDKTISTVNEFGESMADNIFDKIFNIIQAFFPLPVRSKRKVAKVEVYTYVGIYWKIDNISGVNIH